MSARRTLLRRLLLIVALVTAILNSPVVGAEELLPVEGLAAVRFEGADLEKTRPFYEEVLGFEKVSPLALAMGDGPHLAFKVNDDQFLKFSVGQAGAPFRLVELSLRTSDIGRARAWTEAHGLAPGPIEVKGDGNPQFAVRDPDGLGVEFVEYRDGSRQAGLRGKGLGERRVSDRLQHAGLVVADEPRAMKFYRAGMGFWEQNRGGPPANPGQIRWIIMMLPGPNPEFRRDFIEFMVYAAEPPERRQHLCFAVPDIERAHQALVARPGLEQKFKPFTTPSGLKLMNVRDPNGMRVEFWEVKPAANP